MNLTRFGTRKLAIILAIGLAIVVFIFVIYNLLTNGRLSVIVSNSVKVDRVVYCDDSDCDSKIEKSSSDFIIPSGHHFVIVYLSNGMEYMTSVEIGRFLAKTSVNVDLKKYSIYPVAMSTHKQILPLKSSFVTYENNDVGNSLDDTVKFTDYPVIIAQYIDGNNLMVLNSRLTDEVDSGDVRATIYDRSTGSAREVINIPEIKFNNVIGSYRGIDHVYIVSKNGDETALYRFGIDGVSKSIVPKEISYALDSSRPIVAISDEYFVVLHGNNYRTTIGSDDHNDEDSHSGGYSGDTHPVLNDTSLTIYDKNFKEIKSITIDKRNDVYDLSLSPDNKYIAAISDFSTRLYDIKTGAKVSEFESDNADDTALNWLSDDKFVFKQDNSVFIADVRNNQATSVIENDLIGITDISAVVDNKIYLTAASVAKDSPNSAKTGVDGYIIDLNNEVDSATAVKGKSIIRSLPIDGGLYMIGYRFNGNREQLVVNASDGFRNMALGKIYQLGFDPADYNIIFDNYKNRFEEGK